MSERLPLRDRLEARGLSAYLSRLITLDSRASVRLQASGLALGVWGSPPLGVVTIRPVRLSDPAQVDRTVSASRLLGAIETPTGDAGAGVVLPPVIPGPAWAGLLPGRTGWTLLATVPVALVADALRVGIDAFGRRVDQLPPADRTPAALEVVANEVWNRPAVADVPLRAVHAARLTGLLGSDGEVSGHAHGPWLRLSCPGGSVALRRDGALGVGLDLDVWSLGHPAYGSSA